MSKVETQLQEKTKNKLQKPRKYKVILHNDNITTMDFVVMVLCEIFHKDVEEATKIMLTIHTLGSAVCAIYIKSIAEKKALKVTELARSHNFPLKCTIEEE